jgi:ribosome biogenesis GTPase
MDSRQEKRSRADLRHREREKRLKKILAAKAKPQATEIGESDALVIGLGPGMCTVLAEGELRHVRCEIPVVPGDEVSIRYEKVSGIAPRRTTLSRTDPGNEHRERLIAANIDLLVVVAAMVDPPFRPGLIDRYLVAAARGGIKPILCINKIDLCRDTSAADIFRIPIVRCSTATGEGIDELRDLLAGSLAVLAGHSGVGKSSLLNALASEEKARTGGISEETGKGRHTTTASRLYHLKNGARIIDTPGIKELGLGEITAEELRAAFPELAGMGCRFANCMHRDEPDCPVREAGGVRYEAYLRLMA